MTTAAILKFELSFEGVCSLVGLWQRIMEHKLFGEDTKKLQFSGRMGKYSDLLSGRARQ